MKKPKWDDYISKYIKESKVDYSDYRPYYLDKINNLEGIFSKEVKEKMEMGKRQESEWSGPSAKDRAQFARERRAVEGSVITQKGFEGSLVLEHIRGSQYLIRMPNGTEVFASHKKQRQGIDGAIEQSVSTAGWRLWDNGSTERT